MAKSGGWKTCWVCERRGAKGFHGHHTLGLKQGPKVDLCPGCHWLVTLISRRKFLAKPHAVANLITLARFQAGLPDAKTIVRYE